MTKKILGISAFYHDSAAAIIINGEIIAAAQEERFSRKKHDPEFPVQAILFCLAQAHCSISDLDCIIFYDKPLLKFERLLETYFAHAPRGIRSFIRAMPIWLKEKLYLKTVLRRELRLMAGLDKKAKLPQLLFSEHHLSHAGSAFFPSPYDDAAVLCLDGVGEWATSSAWQGRDDKLNPLWEIQFPHSLGLLYSAFTYYAGFKVNSGEYKLMGLAPFGEPKYVDVIFKQLVDVKDDGSFVLNMSYFDFAVGSTMTNDKFHQLFGAPPRTGESEISQKEMDLARSIQVVTEEIVLKIVQHLSTLTTSKNLCLAGGVALNCVANGRILREGAFDNIWIQPAAGDAGGALGAALVAWHHYFEGKKFEGKKFEGKNNVGRHEQSEARQEHDLMQGAYLGPSFTNDEICQILAAKELPFTQLSDDDLYNQAAQLLDEGNVIGWFQGKMEFGPRALGNRSILGDARNQKMQSVMNLKIKYRESFRPFAPIVLAEDVSNYFQHQGASPYMLIVADINDELRLPVSENLQGIEKLNQARSTLPAITHVDYTARLQTVHSETNPKLHQLLNTFKKRTHSSVLINTSFNVRGEPPVCTPEDAINCFLNTEMDYLVMENVLLRKTEQSESAIAIAKLNQFELD
ncbi:MAG: carbamoyltransferase [Colwellia sp.]|nr:carbamoyltransferase [Colwellia sp.]